MERILSMVVTALVLLSCSGTNLPALTEKHDLAIAIKKIGWDVVTSTNITCSDFDEMHATTYVIHDISVVKRIMEEVGRMTQREVQSIDVRCKLYVLVNDSVKSVTCLNRDVALHNGKMYTPTPELIELIDSVSEVGHVDSLSSFHYERCHLEEDMDRFYTHLQSRYHRLAGYLTEAKTTLFVKCRINSKGECLEVMINNPNGHVPLPLMNELERIVYNEFQWSPCEERLPTEWLFLPVTFKNQRESTETESGIIGAVR